jgi:hypothetical protein
LKPGVEHAGFSFLRAASVRSGTGAMSISVLIGRI